MDWSPTNTRPATASFLAKLNADRIARYIYEHGATWPYQKIRLGELIETKDSPGDGANRILDAAGKVIVAEAALPARFQFTRSSAIVVAGATVGSVEHARSAGFTAEPAGSGRIVQPSPRVLHLPGGSHLSVAGTGPDPDRPCGCQQDNPSEERRSGKAVSRAARTRGRVAVDRGHPAASLRPARRGPAARQNRGLELSLR